MAEDWASRIRESIDRSNKAMDLYKRQTQAGAMNAQSGGLTKYTAIEGGGITDVGSFTPAPAGMSASQFSGGPIESASFFGSGQINEVGGTMTSDGQPRPRTRGPATPMQQRLMGSAGGGGLYGFNQNQRNASSWENLQRRNSFMPPNQRTPRQRFTA